MTPSQNANGPQKPHPARGYHAYKKQILQILTDLLMVTAAYTGAWLLRFDAELNDWNAMLLEDWLPWLLAIKLASFWLFGLYKGDWRYISIHDLVQIFKACVCGSAVFTLILLALGSFTVHSKAVLIIDLVLCILFVAGVRSLIRIFREKVRGRRGEPVLILGAGDGGELLLRELRNNPQYSFVPVGFLDDDPAKKGSLIHGIPVLGNRRSIPALCEKHHVNRVFISILSARRLDLSDVYQDCAKIGVKCSLIQPIINISAEDL